MTPSWLLDLVTAILLAVAVASVVRLLMIPLRPRGRGGPCRLTPTPTRPMP
jgi:hypothetical protein